MLCGIREFRQQISCCVPLTDVSPFFSHRNVMMRLNLQLTMGTFSVSLFGLIGVAFGMNLKSSLEEVRSECCTYQHSDSVFCMRCNFILPVGKAPGVHQCANVV